MAKFQSGTSMSSPVTGSLGSFGSTSGEVCDEKLTNVVPRSLPGTLPAEKMLRALSLFKESSGGGILAQVWMPIKSGNDYVLSTSEQPFLLDQILSRFREVLRAFTFSAEEGPGLFPNLPGRVFISGLPKWASDGVHYSWFDHSRVDYAVHHEIHGSLAVPIFEAQGSSCCAVLEVTKKEKPDFDVKMEIVCSTQQAVELTIVKAGAHQRRLTENQISALTEILDVIRSCCHSHMLPSALMWVPLSFEGQIIDQSMSNIVQDLSSSPREKSLLCIQESACYANDTQMNGFLHACAEHCLEKGQRIAEKVLLSNHLFFSHDVRRYDIREYPFAHHALKYSLHDAVAVRLRSTFTGTDDYVLEFFLPVNCEGSSEQQELLNNPCNTLQGIFRSLRTVLDGEVVGATTTEAGSDKQGGTGFPSPNTSVNHSQRIDDGNELATDVPFDDSDMVSDERENSYHEQSTMLRNKKTTNIAKYRGSKGERIHLPSPFSLSADYDEQEMFEYGVKVRNMDQPTASTSSSYSSDSEWEERVKRKKCRKKRKRKKGNGQEKNRKKEKEKEENRRKTEKRHKRTSVEGEGIEEEDSKEEDSIEPFAPSYINCRCVINRFNRTMSILRPYMSDGHHNLMKITPFHQLLDLPYIVQERSTIDYILGCYDFNLGCFNILGRPLYFQADDVSLLTGLPLKGMIVDVKSKGKSAIYNQLKEGGHGISRNAIETRLEALVHSREQEDERDFVKLYCIYILGTILMPHANFDIPRWIFKYADNLEELSIYAWGMGVYNWLMDVVPDAAQRVQRRNAGEKLNVGYLRGCISLLTIWFYDLTGLVDPISSGKIPCILNWRRETCIQKRTIDKLLAKKKFVIERMLPSYEEEKILFVESINGKKQEEEKLKKKKEVIGCKRMEYDDLEENYEMQEEEKEELKNIKEKKLKRKVVNGITQIVPIGSIKKNVKSRASWKAKMIFTPVSRPSWKAKLKTALRKKDAGIRIASKKGSFVECDDNTPSMILIDQPDRTQNSQRKKIKKDFEGMQSLTEEEKAAVQRFLELPMNECAVFSTDYSFVKRSFVCDLLFGKWLWDDVVDVFISMLKEKMDASPHDYIPCYIFRPFFHIFMKAKKHDTMKWTFSNFDRGGLEDGKSIFIPMCSHDHWHLLVLRMKEKIYEHYSSIRSAMYKVDAEEMKNYFSEYCCHQLKYDGLHQLPLTEMSCPQQEGGGDCGIYVIRFIELLAMDKPLALQQNEVPGLRAQLAASIIIRGELQQHDLISKFSKSPVNDVLMANVT